jgi:hypothetical protein
LRFCHWMTNIIEQGLPWGVNGNWKTSILEQGLPWEVNGRRITNIIEQGPPSEVHGHRRTNIIDQCPYWEIYSRPDDQEILCVLWKMEVHYRVHNSSLLVPVLSLVSPVRSVSHSFCSKWFTRAVKRSVVVNDYTDKQIDKLLVYKQLIYFTLLMLLPFFSKSSNM